jgi:hypothetical protein
MRTKVWAKTFHESVCPKVQEILKKYPPLNRVKSISKSSKNDWQQATGKQGKQPCCFALAAARRIKINPQ